MSSPKITVPELRGRKKLGPKIAMVTAYDATMAKLLEAGGADVLLVGDSLGMVVQGLPNTLPVTLDEMCYHGRAVARAALRAHVMGDMPFMSYQADEAEGLRNAGRFMTQGTADAVKLEVDRNFAPLVEKMARAGVPVVAHIGAKPQQSKLHGGYGSAGRTAAEAQLMIADAVSMQEAGATMLLVEACPNEVSQRIIDKTSSPVIGCGGGPACHGQIVVLQDLLGLTSWQPAFARPIAQLGEPLAAAARKWVSMVRRSDLGEHPYRMTEDEKRRFGG
jgi:3-methyl-2-oxobutanoate hydroxymethyltransferase